MIAYDLKCAQGHQFEGWFEDAKAFETQQADGYVACPVCDSADVQKIPSTFGIKGARVNAKVDATDLQVAALGKQIADFVEKNFDDVGSDFTDEALKMHYGVSEPRNIRGTSTEQEEQTLKKEGITFFKLPVRDKCDPDG